MNKFDLTRNNNHKIQNHVIEQLSNYFDNVRISILNIQEVQRNFLPHSQNNGIDFMLL